jgi:hypothetical protein
MRFFCPRCFVRFKSQLDLSAHARSETPCRIQDEDPSPSDGINEDTQQKLRSRKYDRSGSAILSEAEKWKQMYRICFPDVPSEEVPSPCKATFPATASNDLMASSAD